MYGSVAATHSSRKLSRSARAVEASRDAQLGAQHPPHIAHLRGCGKRVRPGLVRACHAQRAQTKKVQTPGLVLGAVAASGWAVVARWVEGERAGAKAPSSGAFEQLFPVAPELA